MHLFNETSDNNRKNRFQLTLNNYIGMQVRKASLHYQKPRATLCADLIKAVFRGDLIVKATGKPMFDPEILALTEEEIKELMR